jgi:predicted branched-subunit amino acid permease
MSRIPADVRRGARAILPMLIGVVPFGFIAGASPVTGGLGAGVAFGFSTIVFAGASQLVAIEALVSGKGAAVAIAAAIAINLRMMLYSASLAPVFGRRSLADRLRVAYLLTDQAYAVTISEAARLDAEGELSPEARRRIDRSLYRYYLGAGLTLWGSWQIATAVGALVGNSIPKDLPVDFAVPLVFLVLLVPTLGRPHSWVAALSAGISAVVVAELGWEQVSILVGALVGIACGFAVETWWPDRSRSDGDAPAESGVAGVGE